MNGRPAILDHLEAVTRNGAGFRARCPVHDDREPSLAINVAGDKVLIFCHGCTATGDDICRVLGLNPSEYLFLDTRPKGDGRSRLVERSRYTYTDEGGVALFDVVRYEPKAFRQHLPGRTTGGIGRVRRVLYRLPGVVAAVRAGEPICVVEGEKDADRLLELGLCATTSPMGAGKWRSEYSEILRGARVVIISDNDPPGRAHADTVSESLEGAADEVAVVDLAAVWPDIPDGGDVSDWLDGPGSLDELKRLFSTPPKLGSHGAVTLAAALEHVDRFLDRFVYFEKSEQRHAVALWVVGTYVFDTYDATPYLHIRSPEKRSGKTLLLESLELLVRSPLAAFNASPAALFRSIEERRPTLLFDEVDAIFPKRRSTDPAKEDLRGILNAGYKRGATVLRSGGGANRQELQTFEVFCPKALAGIGDLPDTVADRTIPIALQRKPPSVRKERFRLRMVRPRGRAIAEDLVAVTEGLTEVLARRNPDLPDALNDREQDLWELLFAIADEAGGDWPEWSRQAALTLSADSVEATQTTGLQLLSDVRQVWPRTDGDPDTAVPTARLLDLLQALEEAQWGDWFGKPIDARFLAKHLKPYGISSTKVKVGGKPLQGYRWNALAPVWERYLPVLAEPGEPAEPFMYEKGFAAGTETEPNGNQKPVLPEGSAPVPLRFSLEPEDGARRVPQVPEVPSGGQTIDSVPTVGDWRGPVEEVARHDGEVAFKVRDRVPATLRLEDLEGPVFGVGDVVSITPNESGQYTVKIQQRVNPL